jgi:hypothetical protein
MSYKVGKSPTQINTQVALWMSAGQPSQGRMTKNILTHSKTGHTEQFFVNDDTIRYRETIRYSDKSAYKLLIIATSTSSHSIITTPTAYHHIIVTFHPHIRISLSPSSLYHFIIYQTRSHLIISLSPPF